jgi:hypothetical protein
VTVCRLPLVICVSGSSNPAPTAVVPAFHQHAMERQRRPLQPFCAVHDAFLCDFDPVRIALREQFHDRPPGANEVGSAWHAAVNDMVAAIDRKQLPADSRLRKFLDERFPSP